MNRGGHTNINGAPVDSLVPVLDHLNTVEAMTKALDNPAFAAKWGDMLRAKHPVLARAYDNAKVSRANDGNFMPRGMEQTPFDEVAMFGARGEEQRRDDPLTVAGMDDYLAGKDAPEFTGGKGVKSDMGGEGKNERPRDIAPLVTNLAQKLARLKAALARNGGIPRVPASVTGIQGVKGLRGQDAAPSGKAMDARRKAADARIKSTFAFAEAIKDKSEVRLIWDASMGGNKLDTE